MGWQLTQQWVLDPGFWDHENDSNNDIRREVMILQQDFERNNDSYIGITLDDLDEWETEDEDSFEEPRRFPAIRAAMIEAGIDQCLVMIWW